MASWQPSETSVSIEYARAEPEVSSAAANDETIRTNHRFMSGARSFRCIEAPKRPWFGSLAAQMTKVKASATDVAGVLSELERAGKKKVRDLMGPRNGIHTTKAYGVTMAEMKAIAKRLGKDHDLAAALWESGWYEARMLASLVDDPKAVTPAQMDRWCKDFDNWALCDTVCFHLFDRTEHAFRKVAAWSKRRAEFEKRAAFALLASLALHRKVAPDDVYLDGLVLVEVAATDPRNFVKKAVNWALRAIGKRNPALRAAALKVAARLAAAEDSAARWVGKGALRELR